MNKRMDDLAHHSEGKAPTAKEKIRVDEEAVKLILRELEVASPQEIFDALDEQAGGTLDLPEYEEVAQVMDRLEDVGEVQPVFSEGFTYVLAESKPTEGPVATSDIYPHCGEEGPPLPKGHLFEFCSSDYWQSLDISKLLVWIKGVSTYLLNPDPIGGVGTSVVCSDTVSFKSYYEDGMPKRDVFVLANSGHHLEEFDDEKFAVTELHKFLCWASQRLMWLDRTVTTTGEDWS